MTDTPTTPVTVFVVITQDRHVDIDVTLFTTADAAISYARKEVRDNLRYSDDLDEDLTDNMRAAGWLYYGCYSCEGDCVRVVEREIKSEP